ncbi:helix-turn-helix domain-containing protein [Paraburkholderia ribeironis]|uniref:helix-turn-helix domain-containing protein n=1 Tax=Paraburkholderia ribeironis TaxID=1247936 RepID=UPI000B9D52F5
MLRKCHRGQTLVCRQAAYRIFKLAVANTSVTDVALRLGFAHVGRFSADYRAAFGEPPAATLRRYRQR